MTYLCDSLAPGEGESQQQLKEAHVNGTLRKIEKRSVPFLLFLVPTLWHAAAVSAAAYLRFIAARLRNPGALLALREGFGIEQRAARCRPYWVHHLRHTKQFITAAVIQMEPRELLVWGAGRLFDLPFAELASPVQRITVVDYDPSCQGHWNTARRKLCERGIELIGTQLDITGRLECLTNALDEVIHRYGALTAQRLVETLQEVRSQTISDTVRELRADLSISLNMLSQLGIAARRIVQRALTKASWKGPPQEEILAHHLREFVFQIEFEHLELLSSSARAAALLITDEQFIDYSAHDPTWKSAPALELPLPLVLPAMNTVRRESWYWHLAPQGVEYKGRGEIHLVTAYAAVHPSTYISSSGEQR